MKETLKNPVPLLTFERTSLFVSEGQYWLGNNMSEIAIPMDDDLLDAFLYIIFLYVETQGGREQALELLAQDFSNNG